MTTQATIDTIVYPETDGKPMPDGEYQASIYRRTVVPLEGRFNGVPGARVNGNTIMYYVEGDNRFSVSPDCYVVFGLSEAAIHSLSLEGRNTYLLWEVGKPPEFVLEIGSRSTSRADLGRKRDLYAQLGVSEYWRYDASGGRFYGEPLVGERLVDGEYRRLDMHVESEGRVRGYSDALNLDLWWIDGELRFWDPAAENWLLTYEEQQAVRLLAEERAEAERERADTAQARADTAQARADRAKARADAEQARAESAEARLAEMEAELRRLRGERH